MVTLVMEDQALLMWLQYYLNNRSDTLKKREGNFSMKKPTKWVAISVMYMLIQAKTMVFAADFAIKATPIGAQNNLTLSVNVQPDQSMVGQAGSFFVVAKLRNNTWFYPVSGGWRQWNPNTPLPPYITAIIQATNNFTPIQSMDVSSYAGTIIYAGYGLSMASMINAGTYNPVYTVPPSAATLKISAFRDISAFIFEEAKQIFNLDINVYYVKNADEAHSDLMNKRSDIVFMSYDDTLSIAFQNKYSDIAAVMPVHYGILDLCGDIDLFKGKNIIGIDTDSGYARALRFYLHRQYPVQTDYDKLNFQFSGATNLRYDKLVAGTIDATLLNPPFSYEPGAQVIVRMYDVIGAYQGVVANINKSWLADNYNQYRLNNFISIYSKTIQFIMLNPDKTIADLAAYYNLSLPIATAIYNRLLQPDGLNTSINFDNDALLGTEKLFTLETGISVPEFVIINPSSLLQGM